MTTPPRSTVSSTSTAERLKDWKWLSWIVLAILLATTYMNIYSAWGLLFIYWGARSMVAGEAYLIEPIEREKNPALYWIVSIMWIAFGALYVLVDFYPEYLL